MDAADETNRSAASSSSSPASNGEDSIGSDDAFRNDKETTASNGVSLLTTPVEEQDRGKKATSSMMKRGVDAATATATATATAAPVVTTLSPSRASYSPLDEAALTAAQRKESGHDASGRSVIGFFSSFFGNRTNAATAATWSGFILPLLVCVVAVVLQIAAWRLGGVDEELIIDRHAWGGYTSTPPEPSPEAVDALDAILGNRNVLVREWAKARALHKHGGDPVRAAAAIRRAIDAPVDVEAAYAAGLITSRPGNPHKLRRLPVFARRRDKPVDAGHVIADGGNLNGFYPDTYAKIVELSGGPDEAVICVVPMASCSLKPSASAAGEYNPCLLYTSPSPRDATLSRMPSSA